MSRRNFWFQNDPNSLFVLSESVRNRDELAIFGSKMESINCTDNVSERNVTYVKFNYIVDQRKCCP